MGPARSPRAAGVRSDPARPGRGFSLIEILMVVALFALAAGLMGYVLGSGFQGRQLRQAAQEVALALKFTRGQALASGQAQLFTLDVHNRQWDAAGKRHGQLPEPIQVEVVTARQEQVAPQVARIRFFADGSATGGGVTVSRGRAQWRVAVDWVTGRVRMRRGEDAG